MFTKLNKFLDWFGLKFGWFFTNRNRIEYRNRLINEKLNTKRKHTKNNL